MDTKELKKILDEYETRIASLEKKLAGLYKIAVNLLGS